MAESSILSKTPRIYLSVRSNASCVRESTSYLLDLLAFKISVDEINFIVISIVPWAIFTLLIFAWIVAQLS